MAHADRKLEPVVNTAVIAARGQEYEIADLLSRYESKLSELITYDHFEYFCEVLGQHFIVGWPQKHQCSYELTLGSLHYGDVVVTRSSPFRETELKALESCLSDLFRMLRSATKVAA